jgi:hypothetical protein
MWDNLHIPDDRSDLNGGKSRERETAPVSDREVPLNRHRTPALVHEWLDGAIPESEVRRGDMVKDVDFWKKINEQAAERRRMQTPAYVERRIMAAITAEVQTVPTPWLRKPVQVSTVAMIAAAAALLAAGAVLGVILLGR